MEDISALEYRLALEKCYIVLSGIIQSRFDCTNLQDLIVSTYEFATGILWPESFDVADCGCVFPYGVIDDVKLCRTHQFYVEQEVRRRMDG